MGPTTGTAFKGFMIQARRVADDSPVGMFAFSGLNFQAQCDGNVSVCVRTYVYARACVGECLCMSMCTCIEKVMVLKLCNSIHLQTSATHTNNDPKEMVSLLWTAPPAQTGEIFFR